MACYHPLTGIYYGERTENGKRKLRIVSGIDPTYNYQNSLDVIPIPCGRCIGCRLDYSRAWANRMLLELETMKKGVFVTLTYNNEKAPWKQFGFNGEPLYASLDKTDIQKFFKRLRKNTGWKVRYYLAGEYGPTTKRPHYHAIIFGIGLDDLPNLEQHGTNELGQKYYICPLLSEIWSKGFVLVSDVSYKTCAYVARYVTKKLTGDMAIEYARRNVIPEFSLMSRKPGIGFKYLEEHPECLDYLNINLTTQDGGVKIDLPKYYLDKLKLKDKERYDKLMEERRNLSRDKMILKLQKTGLSYLDYLEVEEENRKAKVKALKRKEM